MDRDNRISRTEKDNTVRDRNRKTYRANSGTLHRGVYVELIYNIEYIWKVTTLGSSGACLGSISIVVKQRSLGQTKCDRLTWLRNGKAKLHDEMLKVFRELFSQLA